MIKTLSGLDKWIKKNPKKGAKGDIYFMSRYGALKFIFGEDKADSIMNNLMVKSWDLNKPMEGN
tara:strand:+ start:292 stop:483 length:192 start_codon:yes stop_codon:yes gene_type:complete